MSTPSEVLTAAADRLRDLAAAATPGQWAVEERAERFELVLRSPSADVVVVHRFSPHPDSLNRADARWIAALSPVVAPAMESVLRAMVPAAEQAEAIPREARVYPKGFHAVLDLARAVLGVGEEQQ